MTDSEPKLNETSKTETTVRQYDSEGKVSWETTTVVVMRTPPPTDLPTGMYL